MYIYIYYIYFEKKKKEKMICIKHIRFIMIVIHNAIHFYGLQKNYLIYLI